MNNKGFVVNILQMFLLKFSTLIFLIISFLLSTINNIGLEIITPNIDPIYINYSDKTLTYALIEEKINEATSRYVLEKEFIKEGYTSYINIDYLQKEYYIVTIRAIDDSNVKCDGYGSYKKINDELQYKSYIKCGDLYTTEGFNASYIEIIKY